MVNGSTDFFALLIGIDYYFPNELPDGGTYLSLGGCVHDVNLIEDFLQRKLGLPKDRIIKLSATVGATGHPIEPQDHLPTCKNIIDSFKRTTELAQAGDQIFIHYSGHGGRTITAYEDLKGPNGIDEALVPVDIGFSESNYLRDVQLAFLLKAMVDKGIVVSIVLDSCHSGGATRGNAGAARRGISNSPSGIDSRKGKFVESVAPVGELSKAWLGLATNRNVKTGSGWLLEPKGYVLLAACRSSEAANEFYFEGGERNGALTYWLLNSLKQIGPGLSFKMLHDRILAKVHSQFPEQTPQLEGEKDRVVFGTERVQPTYGVLVTQVDASKNRAQLNAGQANGLRKGAKFAIYPPQTQDFTQTNKRIALAEIKDLGAVDSWASITDKLQPNAKIDQGSQAVFLEPGNLKLQRTAKVLVHFDDTKPNTNANEFEQIKKRMENAIISQGKGFLRLSAEKEPADFQVAITTRNKEFQIWDSAGNSIPNLRPPISTLENGGDLRVANRLVQLSKYRNVLELDNNDALSPLARKLQVELIGVQSNYDPVDKPNPRPFGEGDMPTVRDGEWVFLRIKNNLKPLFQSSTQSTLNITVLDLQPDWGISQVYPSGAGFFEPLDAGQEIILPLNCTLPNDYESGTDNIKVFATEGTTNFRWLELPSLDQPTSRKAGTRLPADPLERLLSAVSENQGNLRDTTPAAYPSREWTTAQVQLWIRKCSK